MSDKYLITKADIDAFNGTEKVHYLNPNARRINKSLGDQTGLKAIGFHIIEVPPGCETTELHAHHHEEECIYVLSGQANAVIGDEVYPVAAGDFIGYRAGGKAHKLTNTGQEPLRCIVVGQRLDHDVADYPGLKKRLFRNKGMAWSLVDVADIQEPVAGAK